MANRTNSSEYFWSYEYYWDYIDPIPVDGSKLKVNKYSIVIAFWVGLAAFVTFLFLILLYMSRSGSTPVKHFFPLTNTNFYPTFWGICVSWLENTCSAASFFLSLQVRVSFMDRQISTDLVDRLYMVHVLFQFFAPPRSIASTASFLEPMN
uniref:Uncharacterized protein n=1 Tax=Calidris pygmaea TaxID=425635 RepID=A0A8C3KG90_9CHAR